MNRSSKEAIRWMFVISLIAGTTDGLAAIIVYKADPIKLFQMIASGVLGREVAFGGGLATFAFGLFIHYFIATAWTILFFVMYQKFAWLRKSRIVVIIAYGLLVWVVMNLLIVPLSNVGRALPTFNQFIVGAAILIFAISLPIVLLTERASRPAIAKT
jgi:hypothetical protein